MRAKGTVIRLCAAFVLAASLTAASGGPGMAGSIEGYLYTPFGNVQSAVSVSVNRDGNFYPAGFGWANTWEAAPVGWYRIDNLAPGSYQILWHEKDHWARYITLGVDVPASGTTYHNRTIRYQNMVTGLGWMDGSRHAEWAQSFVATGRSLTMVALHQAIEFGPNTQITIHEGGPTGPQVGPARTIPTNVVNPTAAFWSHGEVPLVPGREYCVRFYVPDGQQLCFLGAGRIEGGTAYPDGRTWRSGEIISEPIKMTLCQDNDGILTVVNTKKKRSDTPALAYASVRSVGQTFVAKGSSLLSASLLVGNTGGQKLNVTLHEDPGLLGEGGPMVGYGKNIKPVDWNWYSGAVWKPGETPLVEGKQYYLKFERADGNPFTVYYVQSDDYPNGELWLGSSPASGCDLSTTITCEEYTGSLLVPTINVSNIQVTRSTESATIAWTTNVATTTNYVDYSEGKTPYTNSAHGESGGTSHSVTLTGLSPNTLYHYRVVSKTAGHRDAYSRDFVFCTDPDSPNLLQNPGFETGTLSPWTKVNVQGSTEIRMFPADGGSDYFGCKAHTGNYFVGAAVNGSSACKGYVYQRVPVTPGRQLKLRAWVWSWQADNLGAFLALTARCRVGIDPKGGTDYNAATISWSPFTVAQDVFGDVSDRKGRYCEAWVSATASSDYVTVWLEGGADQAMAWTVFGLDDAVLTEQTPQLVSRISDLASLPDGAFVEIRDKAVIASAALARAIYVEELDRTAGIRVEAGENLLVDDVVTVIGVKSTRASGEIYLANATCVFQGEAEHIKPLATTAKNLNNDPPRTVGMLMTVAGRVTWDDDLNFWLNDGSLPDHKKIRIDARNLSFWPEHDGFYSVTGVVTLEGSSPTEARPVIIPRDDWDVLPDAP